MGNFDYDSLHTSLMTEGYFYDNYYSDGDTVKQEAAALKYVKRRTDCSSLVDGKRRYEFAFIPTNGFLASPELLMKDCELKLSFDRTNSKIPLTKIVDNVPPAEIKILDCYAVTEYISSPGIRSFFDGIDSQPILYEYEETEVLIKALPKDSTNIQIDNIRGGNVPSYLFAAVIPSENLQGVYGKGATCFKQHNVEEINITLSGNSVSGYPIKVENNSPIFPLHKFVDTTGRLYNVFSSRGPCYTSFKNFMWIWSHKFEAEMTSQGWIGINLKLSQVYSEQMSIVIWIVSPNALTIDKYHQIEKVNL